MTFTRLLSKVILPISTLTSSVRIWTQTNELIETVIYYITFKFMFSGRKPLDLTLENPKNISCPMKILEEIR